MPDLGSSGCATFDSHRQSKFAPIVAGEEVEVCFGFGSVMSALHVLLEQMQIPRHRGDQLVSVHQLKSLEALFEWLQNKSSDDANTLEHGGLSTEELSRLQKWKQGFSITPVRSTRKPATRLT